MTVNPLGQRLLTALSLVTLSCLLWACGEPEEGSGGPAESCRLSSDCASGEECVEGLCVEASGCSDEACPCLVNSDCAPGEACDAETGLCFEIECFQDGDCSLEYIVSAVCV